MGLVYIDGLEYQGNWVTNSGSVTYGVTGRTGKGMQVSGSSGRADFRLPQPYPDYITLGFAWKPSTVTSTLAAPAPLVLIGDNGSLAHVSMNVVGGQIQVVRGGSTTNVIASTTASPFPTAARWYYVEFQTFMSDTVGFVNVNVDGISVIASTATLDTRNAGTNPYFDTVQFAQGPSGNVVIDDLYIMTGPGDSFLGDCIVSTMLPTGNGASSSFVGSDSDSTDNYLLVDEVPPSSGDYVASSTIGARDLYTFSDIPAGAGTIIAVAPTMFVAKDEVGPRQVKPIVRSTTTTAGAAQSLDFAYAQKQSIFTVNPDTGVAWTVAEVNAMQAGVEVA